MQREAAGHSSETRFVERFLGWLDANLPTLPPDSTTRRLLEYVATELGQRHGLPPLGAQRLATLDDATAEILARLAEVEADPLLPMTPDQWRVFGAGLPFTQGEIAETSDRAAEQWLPSTNGRPTVVVASLMHACGVVKGALVESWRR